MVVIERVDQVRAFNRFYTNVIGVLRSGLLDTPWSLTEARLIFELAQRHETDLVEIRRALDIDAGYLSRLLARFEADQLVRRQRSAEDGRRQVVRLTAAGRRAFRTLDERSACEVGRLLTSLSDEDQRRLVGAMTTVRTILDPTPGGARALVLRRAGPGDLGWIVHRHGALYAEEYGWDETFEALVARIVADFADRRDRERQAAWIAEIDGERAGCVLCVEKRADVAKLRLLLVEPWARGTGLGSRLVDECLRFARRAGYARMMLWTNDVLVDARRIYERAGFELVEEGPHHSFGKDLVEQVWERAL